jgi:hypothetical protein
MECNLETAIVFEAIEMGAVITRTILADVKVDSLRASPVCKYDEWLIYIDALCSLRCFSLDYFEFVEWMQADFEFVEPPSPCSKRYRRRTMITPS